MGLDSLQATTVLDSAAQNAVTKDNSDSLNQLQKSAGLMDNFKLDDLKKYAGDAVTKIGEALPSGEKLKDWFKESTPPSDKDRADAEKALENRMSKLIPEADRQTMKEMTTAITNGDSKAFAEAVKKAGGDPEKLKALVTEVDKMLEEKHCSTRLDVTADGKVLVSDTGKETAVAFDPKTGGIEAKSVEHNLDGTILVKPGELLHADTDKTFKEIGDNAVNGVNGKYDFGIIKEFPIEKHPALPHIGIYDPGMDGKDPDWYKKWDMQPGSNKIELLDQK